MRATKEVVRQKIIAARDLIKCHPLTPELATGLFTSKGMGIFRFSVALMSGLKGSLYLPENTRRQEKHTAHGSTDTGVVAACREMPAT